MTRSYKQNDRDHAGLAAGTALPTDRLPRYFAKSGNIDTDPKSVKKDGAGKANWGSFGAEAHDLGYRFTQARRRSNSSAGADLAAFKTKFEEREWEMDMFFEEDIHGASAGAGAGIGSGSGSGDVEGEGNGEGLERKRTGSMAGSEGSEGSVEKH